MGLFFNTHPKTQEKGQTIIPLCAIGAVFLLLRVAPKQTQQGKHEEAWFRTEKSDKPEILTALRP